MRKLALLFVLIGALVAIYPVFAQDGCVPADSPEAQREGAVICQEEAPRDVIIVDDDADGGDEDDERVIGTDDRDTIIIEDDTDIDVEGDDPAVDAGGGDDVIINYGEIDAEEVGIDAGDGDDKILIDGDVSVDDDDDTAIDGGAGDDRITIEDDADVDGVIDGGDGFDTLNLEVDVDEDDYDDVKDDLEDAGSSGCVDISGREYCWRSIEELNSILTIIRRREANNYTEENAAPFSERVNGQQLTAPVAIFCEPNGAISVWDIGANGQGTLAFTVDPTLALIAAITEGAPIVAAEGLGNRLIAFPDDNLQVSDETGYVFTFSAGVCFAR